MTKDITKELWLDFSKNRPLPQGRDRGMTKELWLSRQVILAAMLAAAFLEPAPRVAGFTAGTVVAVALHWREVLNWNLGVQLVLYTAAAVFFLRC